MRLEKYFFFGYSHEKYLCMMSVMMSYELIHPNWEIAIFPRYNLTKLWSFWLFRPLHGENINDFSKFTNTFSKR